MEFIVTGQSGQSPHTDRQTEEDLHRRVRPHAGLLELLPLGGDVELDPSHVSLHGQSPNQESQHNQKWENDHKVCHLLKRKKNFKSRILGNCSSG